MSLTNANGDRVRLNVNSGQTYTMTAQLVLNSLGSATMQGFSSTVNDGGQATFTSNITSGANFTSTSTGNHTFIDLIFANTGAANSNSVFTSSSLGNSFFRCVFHGGRGAGLSFASSNFGVAIECEAYDDNKSNTANVGGFATTGSGNSICLFLNCYSHDHASGSNAHAYAVGSGSMGIMLINSIADTCAGSGYSFAGASVINSIVAMGNNFYNNTVDGITLSNTGAASSFAYIVNNNFLKNAGKAINNTLVGQSGIIYNNGRGAGTQANGGADVLNGIVNGGTDITYANDITPWNAPVTGNFSTTLAAAINAGRGFFLETDGTNTGTVGYPDIGAAQARALSGGQKSFTFGG